jgi:hypothetical protein
MRQGPKQQRMCAICRKPLRTGDDTRRARLFEAEGDRRTFVVHADCLTEDWPRIEVGLERY